MKRKKIWIDLDNSPHVIFFIPIIEEIKKRGHDVVVTARDAYQVTDLADHFNLEYESVGRHYGKNKLLKIAGTLLRSLELTAFIFKEKADLALSHGSRSQVISAKLLGIPSVLAFDYEHAKGLPFLHPTCFFVPEVIPLESIRHGNDSLFRYPGIKEDVYVPTFKPDPRILDELKIDKKDMLVTIRPPATEAHYHNPEAEELFDAAINYLYKFDGIRIVVLPRNKKQETVIANMWPEMFKSGKVLIPSKVVDGLNLIWFSDFVISGGGTMNREAAALGVPVYSIFRGPIGAVDRYLAKSGRLIMLESTEDVKTKIKVVRRSKEGGPDRSKAKALDSIVSESLKIARD